MIVFVDGKPKKDQYRRFKIKTVEGANDYAYRWVAAGLVLAVLSHVIRAFRWGIQLKALGVRCAFRDGMF